MLGTLNITYIDPQGIEYPLNYDLPRLGKDIIIKVTKAIKEEIEYHLFHGLDYNRTAVPPLAPVTIKRKGHSKVFFDTGELFNSIKEQLFGENYGEVFVSANRSLIAEYIHGYRGQDATARMPARNFFGLGNYFNIKIQQIIDAIK